ncbi:glycosyl hydrolase family 76-domain-containing protein [Rhexocercosporidium sp. MPI-PUGE-AT-0058]|nr:glycosyl hydrolase family 76-domain-containing protein [Rhexocercosporidium sp. MPI-PUGE-AT-0058]
MKNFIKNIKTKAEDYASQQNLGPRTNNHPSNPNHTAAELISNTYSYFHSSKNNQFQAKVKSESTLGESDHYGYVVWPVIIMVQAMAETLAARKTHEAISCLQAYWNPEIHGFCAWKMFPGNEDIYYDDNAHAAQALISAYEATHERKYLQQAKSILTELVIPSAQKDGGVPWHTNNQNCRNACSTGPAAVAALRICAIEKDDRLTTFAARALRWLVGTLRDPQDGLIWDSLTFKGDGSPDINKMKWTYNTGFVIHGFTLLYERTRIPADLNMALSLAEAALNPQNSMFDHTLQNPRDRMYSDSSFFLHHLVDGYRVLSKHALKDRLSNEIHRISAWGREFMFDPTDGLYFRGSCPYSISEELRTRFNQKFAANKDLAVNGQERDEQGNLCKTLIGCAAWARILHAAEG